MNRVFCNRKAIFGWAFMGVWMVLLCAFTWILVRDGPPSAQPHLTVIVLMLFWLVGVPATAAMLARPVVEAEVRGRGRLTLRKRYLFGRVELELRQLGADAARIVKERDSDGDPYFHLRLALPDGSQIDLWQGHDQGQADAELKRFLQCLR